MHLGLIWFGELFDPWRSWASSQLRDSIVSNYAFGNGSHIASQASRKLLHRSPSFPSQTKWIYLWWSSDSCGVDSKEKKAGWSSCALGNKVWFLWFHRLLSFSRSPAIALYEKLTGRKPIVQDRHFFSQAIGKDVIHQGVALDVSALHFTPLNPLPPYRLANSKYPLWLCLDQVQDPRNFGAILRSAYFFDVAGIAVPYAHCCKSHFMY